MTREGVGSAPAGLPVTGAAGVDELGIVEGAPAMSCEGGDVLVGCLLTLSSVVLMARPEREGDGGNSWKTAVTAPEKMKTTASIPGSRLRFLLAEGRR